jgi:hypothetical protein
MGCFGSYVVISSLDFSVWFGRAWVSVGFLVFAWMSCCPLFLAASVLICFGCYLDGFPLPLHGRLQVLRLCKDELNPRGPFVPAWMSCCLLFSAVFCFLFFVFFVFAWLAGSGAASVSTWISFRLYMEESTLATALGW